MKTYLCHQPELIATAVPALAVLVYQGWKLHTTIIGWN